MLAVCSWSACMSPQGRCYQRRLIPERTWRSRGPTLEPGPGLGLVCERLVAGPPPMRSGQAQPKEAMWGRPPVGSPPAGGTVRGRCSVDRAAVEGRGPRQPDPWTRKLALGTWNVTSLAGKEPEIVRDVERYQLEIVGSPPRTAWALEPHSSREDGLFTTFELPIVRGGGLVWVCS
ncbi:unnamed protein product [Leuciscus chuanchicus]